MTPNDAGEWHTTNDAERIRDWADRRGGVPVRVDRAERGTDLAVVGDPSAVDGKRIDWEEFFDRFGAEGLAFRYREDADLGGTRRACEVVRGEETEDSDLANTGGERDENVDSDGMALSDTGDDEPVTYDPAATDDEKAGHEGGPDPSDHDRDAGS